MVADLHIHSFFSDGSMTPEEIVAAAVESNVGLLAVTDHNVAEGSLAVQPLCAKVGIRCIPAVEICTLDGNTYVHVLAYGVDLHDAAFRSYLAHTRFLMDESSVKLIEAMQGDYNGVSLSDYFDFTYDRRLGGFKALHYFLEKGITASLMDGMPLYDKYGIAFDKCGFSTVLAAVHRIHRAGGYAVLAHPGEIFDASDIGSFNHEITRIMACGLDGIECYYPKHSEEITQACLDYCRQRDLLVTGGSDCHGLFTGARVGALDITTDMLVLKGLY